MSRRRQGIDALWSGSLRALLFCGGLIMVWGVAVAPAGAACVNEQFRTGLSAFLPDCRAYELVTPPDTNGRRVGAIRTFGTPPTAGLVPYELASPSRDSVVYEAYSSPLLNPTGATGIVDVYQAERSAGAWTTSRRISPPGSDAVQAVPEGVSADHLYAFTTVEGSDSSLSLGGPTEYLANPDGTFELLGLGALGQEPFARGRWISEGGEHVIFSTGHAEKQSTWCAAMGSKCQVLKLEPNAPPTGTGAIYDRSADGPTRVISLLPGEVPPAAGEEAFYKGTSKDGTAVAFTIGGTLYVRVDNAQTLEVAGGEPSYAGMSRDGHYLFYVVEGNIHRFDTETEADDQVNSTGDALVSNVSADGSHVYFISKSQIGGKGTAGVPNLYVWSGFAAEFVASLAPTDIEQTSGSGNSYAALGNWTTRVANGSLVEPGPGAEASRTTPDGSVFVFESRARLTSYDNDGRVEIYRYDDGDGSIDCVSCNPLVPATADARLQELVLTGLPTVIHNVSDDGSRVFFETKEALVSRDGDGGVNDIYQWSEQEGGGGTVDLVSSGQSTEYPQPGGGGSASIPSPNVLLSVTPDGSDVVFLSQDALVPGAPEGGTAAIYDARVNGGFPPPPIPSICAEEGCRPAPQAPPIGLLAPSSEVTTGAGNVKPRKQRRCRKGATRSNKKHRRCSKRKAKRGGARSSAVASRAPTLQQVESEQSLQLVEGASAPSSDSASQAKATGSVASASPFDEFGIESVGAQASTPTAGAHPNFTTNISLNHFVNESTGRPESNARTEEIQVSLPPGMIGNPNAVLECKTGQLVAGGTCPIDSQVGLARVNTTLVGEATFPLYNLKPPHPKSEVARFGFFVLAYAIFVDVDVRTAGDYGVTATVHSSPGLTALLEAETTIWGNPADPSHDENRLTSVEAVHCANGTACKAPEGKRASGLDPDTTVFMSNPSACQAQSVGFAAKSYQLPGQVFSATAPMTPTTGCTGLPFEPSFTAEPTNPTAGAPTGLKTTLMLPQVEDPDSKGTSTMREARVTLPEGMTIAAGAADGLAACSDEQVGYKQEVDAACPDASKLGTATITSPALAEPLEGALYQRTPEKDRLFGFWLVTDELGLHVKLPGEIEPDPNTGQLTAVFTDLPQVPVEEISFNVWGGDRAPLKNPDTCGTYSTSYTFTPHSKDPAVSGQSQMRIDQGCGAGGFSPELHVGVTNPVAGAFSPMVVDVIRNDGEQNLGALAITLPRGELAKLADVPLCPETQAGGGDCPAGSKIGSLTAAVGPGPQPLWLPQPGKAPTAVYLAGPYKDAPFSVVTAVPAQAGPFDLGVVTVRSALDVDPETAQATVKSDPLPQFIEGVAAVYRRLHIVIDRPGFSLNPTNCSELQTTSKITSTKGVTANPSSRFQVDGCKALKFKPSLSLKLKGGTKRGEYPALSATVKARKGDANIGKVSVALPRSEFLAQEHIGTICTRVQFAADDCPKRSVYGKAKAWTPLLDKPLEGLVYLRSSNNTLPDLVVALRGQIDIDLVGRIDSKNRGIRTNFDSVPDAPITKFVLQMKGGKSGLLVNSTDICRSKHRALVKMRAQNGRTRGTRPVLASSGCRNKNG